MAINKIIYGGNVLIDLTADTVTADRMLTGTTAHAKDGEAITGTCDYDSNTQSADVSAAEILLGKTAYARGAQITGTMPNNAAQTGSISAKAGTVTIKQGYHDGSGKIGISSTEQAKIIAGNIKKGVSILGVDGSYEAATCIAQAKEATPSKTQQIIQPDAGYTHLTQVTVKAIPYVESSNSAGGTTATIG